jgi:two-component system response regulator QseB
LNILIVEDDSLIASGLKTALERAHHQATWVGDGLEAQQFLASNRFDLVILDLGLPGRDGFEVLRRLRLSGMLTNVLILSARDALNDRVHGLDLGADDYLVKPFEHDELLARVRVLERRRASRASNEFVQGRLTLDLNAMTAKWDGVPTEISRREWALLRLLLDHPDRVYSRAQIEEALYGWGEGADSNAIDVHVHHLRRKFCVDIVRTVRGVGYRFGSAD